MNERMRHSHSFQHHKICLLHHQRATPTSGKLNNTVDASNLDEQPGSCQCTQEINQTLVVVEDVRSSRGSLWIAVDPKGVFSSQSSEQCQTSNLECQSRKLKIVAHGEICTILCGDGGKSTSSALSRNQRRFLAAFIEQGHTLECKRNNVAADKNVCIVLGWQPRDFCPKEPNARPILFSAVHPTIGPQYLQPRQTQVDGSRVECRGDCETAYLDQKSRLK